MQGFDLINWPPMDNYLAFCAIIGHIWPMLKTYGEMGAELGERVRRRRVAFGWPQTLAAERAGVAYRTWRRLETQGKASVEDLIKAAVALRCEETLDLLFPEPAATSIDALLEAQRPAPKARRARRRGSS